MGTKVIKSIIFSKIFLISIICFSQTTDDKLKYLKKYSYCHCIYINNVKFDIKYLNDKFQISDKSKNEFIDLGKITELNNQEIRSFTEKMTENFFSIESPYYSESGSSNLITSMCLEFYESKELDNFIRKMLKIKTKKKNNIR
ncbi:hypothetical protein SAMN05444671_1220 [Flavobacterium sp. CF108]|uniref:hypothetical protein n=1 Tax=unclassified Flavobacterium TaxID=196869 RepID=UPI0008CBFB56|nr:MULTISPECIES: hypothetical protein [unclassified Flavobacterium]SEO85561.1 hypothetical protein SAMN04487978_3833 [Flavobacterium sp. fv08]SHG69760.1 hypothetical protein SAMN05444671_1220 [Flavobacterium sp. CF108]